MIESYDFSKGKGMKREDQKVQKCTTKYFCVCVWRECGELSYESTWEDWLKRGRWCVGVFTKIYYWTHVCVLNLFLKI